MLEIPENFKKNIMNRYDKKGIKWLANLENIVNKYTDKIQLENVEMIENLSMNFVAFASSKMYGEIVLKIGAPTKTIIGEIKIMKQYHTNNMVKCYYSNLKDRVLILERILPGYSLDNVKTLEDRVKIFCNILDEYTLPDNKKDQFPTHEEKVDELLEYVYKNKSEYEDILYLIYEMENVYKEIQKMNLNRYILHNDLNHKNILKAENGWKVIDPHGLIGEKLIETAQFIRGELEINAPHKVQIEKIVSLIAKELEQEKTLVLKFLYMIIIEKIIWYRKIHDSEKVVDFNIDTANKVLELIKKKD